MSSYQYRKSHCGDKTVVRSSYLYNGISYTAKMISFYWIGPQIASSITKCSLIEILGECKKSIVTCMYAPCYIIHWACQQIWISGYLAWHFSQFCQMDMPVNSLWPNDTIWWHKSGSTLAQVMACCLTTPSHYLNQYWLVISKVQWHSSAILQEIPQPSVIEISLKITYLKFCSNLPGANELNWFIDP